MLIIQNNQIIGNGSPNVYEGMKPWTHDCGAAWWLIDPAGSVFTDSDGTVYHLRKRTQAQMEALPAWIDWNHEQQRILASEDAPAAFQNLPHWSKTFTTADIDAYVDTQVTNLATAKVALAHLGKAVIIIRDYLRLQA